MTIDTTIRKMILQLYDLMLQFVNGSSKLLKKQDLLGSKDSNSFMNFVNRIAMKSAETSADYAFTNMKAAEIKKTMEEKYEFKFDLSTPNGRAIFFLNMFVFGFMTECTSELYTKIGSRLSDDAQRYLVYYIRIAIELNGEAMKRAIVGLLQNGQCEPRFKDRCSTINEMKQEVQRMFQEASDYDADVKQPESVTGENSGNHWDEDAWDNSFNNNYYDGQQNVVVSSWEDYDDEKKNGTYKAHETLKSKDETKELKEQMDRLKRENEALRTDLLREKRENLTLVKDNTNLKEEMEYLKKDMFRVSETNRIAECELKEKNQDIAELETRIKDMTIQMENLKREVEDKSMEIHTLRINNSWKEEELSEPIGEIRDRLRDCQETVRSQQREIMELNMQHKNQIHIILSLTDSRNKYRRQLRSRLEEMSSMITYEKFCELRRKLTERINQLTEDSRAQMRSIEKGNFREKIMRKVIENLEFQYDQLKKKNKTLVEANKNLYEQGQQTIRPNYERSRENELLWEEIRKLKDKLTYYERPTINYTDSEDEGKYRSSRKTYNCTCTRRNRA